MSITTNTPPRVLVPSGREYQRCLAAFQAETGFDRPQFTGRNLTARTEQAIYLKVKGKDVPRLIVEGYADIGLTGSDVCEEKVADGFDARGVRYRTIGQKMCEFSLLLPEDRADELDERLATPGAPPVLIATSFPKFYFRCVQRAIAAGGRLNSVLGGFVPSGSVEIMPELRDAAGRPLCEAVADLVESGESAWANGLVTRPLAEVYPTIVWKEQPNA